MAFAKIRPVPAANATNAVIYARYSSEKQTENSIDFQLRAAHAYCEAKGFAVVGEYIDRAISGTSDNRPEFQRMITDSKRQGFAFVIVYRYDRFARNRYDSAIYKKQLEINGVRVLSTEESIGVGDESIILESIYEAMAESYSRRLSKVVTQGMRETAMKGLSTGGNLSYGLKVVDRKITIDDSLVPPIQYCFEARAEGVSKTKIAEELNRRGYKTKTGKPFTLNTVTQIITNPTYKGVNNYAGIERSCPAIVDVALWEKANDLETREKKRYGQNAKNTFYPLTGKLFCGTCGAAMIGDSASGHMGKQYTYYTCAKKKNHHACTKRSERTEFLENFLCEQTIRFLNNTDLGELAKNVHNAAKDPSVNRRIADTRKRITAIDRELDTVADALIKTTSLSMIKRINEKAESLEKQRNTLDAELRDLTSRDARQPNVSEIKDYLFEFAKGDPSDETFRYRMIRTFINCIYLFDDKLIVYYNATKMKEVKHLEMLTDLEDLDGASTPEGSDSFTDGPPKKV